MGSSDIRVIYGFEGAYASAPDEWHGLPVMRGVNKPVQILETVTSIDEVGEAVTRLTGFLCETWEAWIDRGFVGGTDYQYIRASARRDDNGKTLAVRVVERCEVSREWYETPSRFIASEL
ncbi:hypothetical protein ACFY1P_08335 [Streptomyces sp. NPDC001407]|uniref:hypothetical protein n=1 Tax=Streptomyces sp. NPDC001407 TaxID=3364573 RepID=UPI0036C526AC